MEPLKVLIVGSGVAGPAFASWLAKTGAEITLIERANQVRVGGQQLDLRAQGIPVMKKMGIEAAIRAKVIREPGTQLIDAQGRTKALFAATKTGAEKQSFTTEFEIMRGDLVRILMGLTEKRKNVTHRFGTTVTSLTQDDENDPKGKVHVGFADGRKDDYDLVVAADGTGSRTRQLMLGPDAPDPRHNLGGYIGFFSTLAQPHDSKYFTFCHLPGGRYLGTRKDQVDFTRVYMQSPRKTEALEAAHKSGNLAELKAAWANTFADGAWESKRFMTALKTSTEADDLYSTPRQEVRLPVGSWSKGRVVAIGDAAHAQTANGFGTSWGLVGSYILAGEIATLQKEDPSTAVVKGVKRYEEMFRPQATARHGGKSDYFEKFFLPETALGIRILHSVARVASYFKLDGGLGAGAEESKWTLPEYPALFENRK
ncbi:hypothetical protein SNK03_006564 [Fusarium graminearum]